MKKILVLSIMLACFAMLGLVKCHADNLTVNVASGVTLSVPFNSLSVDYLVDVSKSPNPQFLAGLRTPVVSYKNINVNLGAITSTGYSYRAYYSIGYDYVSKNPNLLMLISEINVGAFFSTYFDGNPNLYGITLSKKLW